MNHTYSDIVQRVDDDTLVIRELPEDKKNRIDSAGLCVVITGFTATIALVGGGRWFFWILPSSLLFMAFLLTTVRSETTLHLNARHIETITRFLGICVRRQDLQCGDLLGIEVQCGGIRIPHYDVRCVTPERKTIVEILRTTSMESAQKCACYVSALMKVPLLDIERRI